MKLTESLFNIDFKDVIREVANDVRDDWYPDPLYYEDQYKEPGIVERVNNVISSGGQLSSIYCDRYDFPKDDKHVRPAMYLDGVSRLLYHSSVRFVYNYYESNVPAIVFSGRIDRSDKSRKLFRRGTEQWSLFRSACRGQSEEYPWMLAVDIENYYDHITLSMIERSLDNALKRTTGLNAEERVRIANTNLFVCSVVEKLLNASGKGLPQNYDPSAMLANVVMYEADRHLSTLFPKRYMRYMDDMRFVFSNEREANDAVAVVQGVLRDIGLSLNSKKSFVADMSDPESKGRTRIAEDRLMRDLTNMMRSSSEAVRSKAVRMMVDIVIGVIRGEQSTKDDEDHDLQERRFRYSCNRLATYLHSHASREPLHVFSNEELRTIVNALFDRDNIVRSESILHIWHSINMPDDMVGIIEERVADGGVESGWLQYHVWRYITTRLGSRDTMVTYARDCMQQELPNNAGAILYLGSYGKEADVLELIDSVLKNNPSCLAERASLLALRGLSWRTISSRMKGITLKNCHQGLLKEYNRHESAKTGIWKPPQISDDSSRTIIES